MHRRSWIGTNGRIARRLIATLLLWSLASCQVGSPVARPAIAQFTANAKAIQAGEEITLEWSVFGASRVNIEPRIGLQDASGRAVDRPLATTTYRLTVPGAAEEISAEVTIFVIGRAPIVEEFRALPRTIAPGESAEVAWRTAAAERVTLEPGLGALAASGAVRVTPSETTTYRLTALQGAEAAPPETVTVRVASGPEPIIRDLSVSPRALSSGEVARLTWEVTGATAVTIDNGLGLQAQKGSANVRPTRSGVYTLTAVGPSGTSVASVGLRVAPTGAPAIAQFTASPSSVASGQEVRLTWDAGDASRVLIEPGVGIRAAKGSEVIRPEQSTTFTLTAFGASTPLVETLEVQVAGPTDPAILELRAEPARVARGGRTRLSWRTSQVDRVELTPGVEGPLPANGSIELTPSETTTYTLTARGRTGSTARPVTVTVGPPLAGDRCDAAIPIEASGRYLGDTREATDDLANTEACTGHGASGPDVTHRVRLARGDRLRAKLTASGGWDAALYLLTGCDAVAERCVSGQDNGGAEELDYTAASPGEFFLVVDGFAGAGGPYELAVTLDRSEAVEGGDICRAAIPVPGEGGSFSATTQEATDDYHPPASCTGYETAGPDMVYALEVEEGDVVEARATFGPRLDGAIYVVTVCDPAPQCTAASDTGVEGEPESLRFVAENAIPHFLVVDSVAAGAGGAHQISIGHFSGETCATAPSLPLGGRAERWSTRARAGDYSPPVGGCTRYRADGPDRVYAVDVVAGDQVQVAMTSEGFDGVLYAVSSCEDIAASCIDGADVQEGGVEEIAPVFAAPGRAFVIVDGFAATDAGRGAISARVVRGDACADAYRVPARRTPVVFRGTTRGYGATLGTTETSTCTGRPQLGRDAVYAVQVPAGRTLTAKVEAPWDVALYLVSDCERSATTCLAGNDDGNVEELRHTNPGPTVATYHLIIDSERTGPVGGNEAEASEGEYTLTVLVE